jgi:hypothetical protein
VQKGITNEILDAFLSKELKAVFDYSKLQLHLPNKMQKVTKNKI